MFEKELCQALVALDLSATELHRSALALADISAISRAASREGFDRELVPLFTRAERPSPDHSSSFWFSGAFGRARDVALLNGVLSHALDFDDVSFPFSGHISTTVYPALLAVAEEQSLPLDRVVQAHAFSVRLGNALGEMNPEHYERGFHATSTLGTLTAAAAVGYLLGYTAEQHQQLFGIASTLCSGLRVSFGTPAKWLQAGTAASNAVYATELIRVGWRGADDGLSGRYGFIHAFAGDELIAERTEAILEAINRPADPNAEKLIFKEFPTCAATHPAIRAALNAREQIDDLTQIASVEVQLRADTAAVLTGSVDGSPQSRQFSLPFAIVNALASGQVVLDYLPTELSEAARELHEVYKETLVDEDLPSHNARVVVRLNTGRTIVGQPFSAPSEPDDQERALRGKLADMMRSHEDADSLLAEVKTAQRFPSAADFSARWLS